MLITTATPSLSKDSPKTTIYNISFTFISIKVVNTATGSVDDSKEANIKQSNS